MNILTKVAILTALAAAVVLVFAAKMQSKGASASAPVMADQTKPLPRLLELGSSKCTPCKAMKPIIASLEAKHAGKLKVDFIDVWEDTKAGEKYSIESIPTQVFFDATGKELYRHQGFYPQDEIEKKMRELGFDL